MSADPKIAIERKYPNVYADTAVAFSADYNFIGTVAELMEDDFYRSKPIHASDFPVALADPAKMLAALRSEDQNNTYVQKAEKAYEAIAPDSTLDRMTALDRCARMAELSLQAMGASKHNIEEYFSKGAELLKF